MVYGLVMRVKVNGKIKQFGMLDSYGNIVRMTYSEMLKHVRKGDVVNIAPNGDYYAGKECTLSDIPLFDDNMNQIGGINYENFFNLLANKIYNENINRELKKDQKRQEEEEKQYKTEQQTYENAQKSEQKAYAKIVTEEKSDIDKSLEVISKLGNGFKREANKRLNHGKYLQHLERIDKLINDIEHIVTECVRAKTTSNNNLRNSGETLYSRKMDAITNDAQLNHYILVHGVIELRNRAGAYYTQARQLIEKELTAGDREFYINRLTQYKVYIHKIQELHKETSSILKENVANKEKAEEQLKQVEQDAKTINSVRYKLTLFIPRIREIRYIQDDLKASLESLDNISDELDSLYKEVNTNQNLLDSLEAGFAEIMQIIEEKRSELEDSHEQYKQEQEVQRIEKEQQEKEKKAKEEEERLQAEQKRLEKEEEKKIIEKAISITNEALRNISKTKDVDYANNIKEECIYSLIDVIVYNKNIEDKINKLKQTFIEKANKIIFKLKDQQHATEVYNTNFEEYTKILNEIEQSQDIDNINSIESNFGENTLFTVHYVHDKDIAEKLKKHTIEVKYKAKKRIDELISITTNNIKNLVQTLKNIKENTVKLSTEIIIKNELEQRALLEQALQAIKDYIVNDINIKHIKYESYLKESERLYSEAISKIDEAIKEVHTEEERKLKIIEREQYVLNLIAEQPIVDTEEDLSSKLSKIERSLSTQDNKLGTIDVSSLDSIQNSLESYKKACETNITEKIHKKKVEEAVKEIKAMIRKLDITDSEDTKQKNITSIMDTCKNKEININDYSELVEELEIYKNKCNTLIEKKNAYKQKINDALTKLNSLAVTADLKTCRTNILNALTNLEYNDRQREDIKKAIQEYENKCKQEASKSAQAKQQDILLETRIKNKLNKITAESKIATANTEYALRKVKDELQNNIDEAYRIINDHMFLDDNKSVQCTKLLNNYANSMQNKLNEKLLKITTTRTNHIELNDLIKKYTDEVTYSYENAVPKYVFENILKLIHGYFYNESHHISKDTSNYELDLSLETQNVLKECFITAIKYLLSNTSIDMYSTMNNSVDKAFNTILNDRYINGIDYLERRMVGDVACDTWIEDLEELLKDTKYLIMNYNPNKDIEPLRLYVDSLGELSKLFML